MVTTILMLTKLLEANHLLLLVGSLQQRKYTSYTMKPRLLKDLQNHLRMHQILH